MIAGRNVGEDDEETVAIELNFGFHLEEELSEVVIEDCEVGLALVGGEGLEPFEN